MSRADDVAQKIREAAGHPRASFLFAIGAERPSPQSAASEAYALGLTNKEERLAKWVAVLKRDAEELFGKPFLEALRDILKEGESEMEIQRGAGFFIAKTQPLFQKMVTDLMQAGIVFSAGADKALDNLDSNVFFGFEVPSIYTLSVWRNGDSKRLRSCTHIVKAHENYPFPYIGDEGLPNLYIQVGDKRAIKAIKAFARAWEAKSKQLKGSREATVTIFQDFA